jgi:hypothetical protein
VSKSEVKWSECTWVKWSEGINNRVSKIINAHIDRMKTAVLMALMSKLGIVTYVSIG